MPENHRAGPGSTLARSIALVSLLCRTAGAQDTLAT